MSMNTPKRNYASLFLMYLSVWSTVVHMILKECAHVIPGRGLAKNLLASLVDKWRETTTSTPAQTFSAL